MRSVGTVQASRGMDEAHIVDAPQLTRSLLGTVLTASAAEACSRTLKSLWADGRDGWALSLTGKERARTLLFRIGESF